MNDIDFEALDQAVNKQMNQAEVEIIEAEKNKPKLLIKDPELSKAAPLAKKRGLAIDFMSKKQSQKSKELIKPVQTTKKISPKIRKNNAVSKTIDDIFRTKDDQRQAIDFNKKQRNKKQSQSVNLELKTDQSTQNHLSQPVEISKEFSAAGGKVFGHYQSQSVSKKTPAGANITYTKDSLNYVADFADKPQVKNSSTNQYLVKKVPTEVIKKQQEVEIENNKTKKTVEVDKKPASPFLESAKVEKRPLGIPEKNYHTNNHQELKIENKIENEPTTALYRADHKIAEGEASESDKKAVVWPWFLLLIMILSVIGVAVWILFFN